ncbi:acetyl-CoA carboxylase, carboxyltransferase subunit beta [Inediibacterium massiliense]|uniref:acetyl-CoA carboxylase, carboxyltransferase subunit beta n=1 Tax=Inediibacterium massiliense TaxID=1658111 RepID=UPI0006B4CD50|nr:acetyl-CoA carboxylase, carboxyltransferase subunit beta [Inediibacterium massiliense]
MLQDLFRKKKYATVHLYENEEGKKISMPIKKPVENIQEELEDEAFIKCKGCLKKISKEDIKNNLYTCPICGEHFRIGPRERIKALLDENSFIEYDKDMMSFDPLKFEGYEEKVKSAKEKSNESEGVITGEGKINELSLIICAMNSNFMMGSMGCVVGEKITRAIEKAIAQRLPVVIFCASGGARMQEGILSLMQMAKTSAALGRLGEEGLLYIPVLTDPTTGGVTASFAMLGDIILAEPKALVGFAGPRVIEQTIRQKLPDGFQRSEFLKEKGFVDEIVHRKDMKKVLYDILFIHKVGGEDHE